MSCESLLKSNYMQLYQSTLLKQIGFDALLLSYYIYNCYNLWTINYEILLNVSCVSIILITVSQYFTQTKIYGYTYVKNIIWW